MSTGRRALVTGGSGGIGAALCRRLAGAGHFVYVHSHRGTEVAAALVREIHEAGGLAGAVSFDITDGGATRVALEEILRDGPIQILVNNAGEPSCLVDFAHQGRGHLRAAVGMHVHEVPGTREPAAERRADAAAAASDQSAPADAHERAVVIGAKVASNTMLARPLSSSCGVPHTENS